MALNDSKKDHSGEVLIYSKYITLRNGRRIYAKDYGKKAFAIWIRKKSR